MRQDLPHHAASLGSRNAHGIWSPSPEGLRALGRLARLTGKARGVLVARIRTAVYHAPFAPAIVIEHPTAALTSYLQERSEQFPGFKVGVEDTRSYPQGSFGSETIAPVSTDQWQPLYPATFLKGTALYADPAR